MDKEYVYRDIIELQTPVGSYIIFSETGERIPFSVIRNTMDWPYEVADDNGNEIAKLHTDTNYCIVIDSKNLDIGKVYKVLFTFGNWEYCDSDEHTTCYDAVIDDWVLGIGAYDPNDQEKEDQSFAYSKQMGYLEHKFIQAPPEYDESKFIKYTVDVLDEYNGYSFRIFDHSFESIAFEVAWIKIEEFPAIEYEGALGLWLC